VTVIILVSKVELIDGMVTVVIALLVSAIVPTGEIVQPVNVCPAIGGAPAFNEVVVPGA
jgi:hypothetical protein